MGSDAHRIIRGGTPLGMEGSLSMKSASEGTGKKVVDSGLGSGSGASGGGETVGKAVGGDDGVCAFCQDDDEVMMCPLCSCRRCFGKQDPSLALLCEVIIILSFFPRGNRIIMSMGASAECATRPVFDLI